jgi:hypothetical protein
VAGAREILLAAEDGSQGPVFFALAETYDPNILMPCGRYTRLETLPACLS